MVHEPRGSSLNANATTDAKSNEGFGDEAALGNKPPIGNARLREHAMQQRKCASAWSGGFLQRSFGVGEWEHRRARAAMNPEEEEKVVT
jgi:hypothetical protein